MRGLWGPRLIPFKRHNNGRLETHDRSEKRRPSFAATMFVNGIQGSKTVACGEALSSTSKVDSKLSPTLRARF